MKCKTQGCDRDAKVRGWCKPHYVKAWKRENVSVERREGNELYNTWVQKKGKRHPEWDSFEVFKEGVGASPGDGFRLTRTDKQKLWEPGNVEWRRVEIPVRPGESSKDYMARASWNTKLKQKYGLTQVEYDQMLENQNGVCAICKTPENSVMFGKKIKLAVDHCHAKGNVRSLLCSRCNTGLGNFRDNPAHLQAAIEYLKSHQEE